MRELSKRHINEIYNCINELYSSKHLLIDAKKCNRTLGELVTTCTRVKIFNGCSDLLRMYRRTRTVDESLLKRTLQRIKLHRFQLNKLSKEITGVDYNNNHKYLVGLAALLHICFAK